MLILLEIKCKKFPSWDKQPNFRPMNLVIKIKTTTKIRYKLKLLNCIEKKTIKSKKESEIIVMNLKRWLK